MSAVITGMGVVSALGCGLEAFAAGLASGANVCAMHEFTLFGGAKRSAPAYLAVPAWVIGRQIARPGREAVRARGAGGEENATQEQAKQGFTLLHGSTFHHSRSACGAASGLVPQ